MNNIFAKFEIKEIKEDGFFSCYGSVFNNVDRVDDIIVKGAFINSLSKKNVREDIKFFLQHDSDKPIGYFTKMEEDERGLYCEGNFILELEESKEAYLLAKNRVLNSFSVGYVPIKFSEKEIDGKQIRVLEEVDLFEISLVSIPANPEAKLLEIKKLQEENAILVDLKDSYFNERTERKNIENKLGTKDLSSLEVDGYLVYSLKNDNAVLNYNAVNSLPEEVKTNNEQLVRKFYMAFRNEYKDYSLFSPVCDKNFVINQWEMKDFDKLLKNNGFGSSEIKSFYDRLAELKNKNKVIEKAINTDLDLDII